MIQENSDAYILSGFHNHFSDLPGPCAVGFVARTSAHTLQFCTGGKKPRHGPTGRPDDLRFSVIEEIDGGESRE